MQVKISCEGVDLFNVVEVRKDIEKQFAIGTDDLELNLKDVNHIDSTGIGLLIRLHKEQLKNGRTLTLVNVPDCLRQILKLAYLDKLFSIQYAA